jgi:hypothetical protein
MISSQPGTASPCPRYHHRATLPFVVRGSGAVLPYKPPNSPRRDRASLVSLPVDPTKAARRRKAFHQNRRQHLAPCPCFWGAPDGGDGESFYGLTGTRRGIGGD